MRPAARSIPLLAVLPCSLLRHIPFVHDTSCDHRGGTQYIQPLEWKGQLKRREPRTTASTCLITYLRREAVYGSQGCVVPDHGASRGVYTNPSLSSLRYHTRHTELAV